jgi:two-component system response regulator FlrC
MTGGQMEMIRVELFGTDARVEKALQQARNLAVSKAAVLIVGENGVGKRTLGRFIHENSVRINESFELVDCSLASQEVENKILGFRDLSSGRFNKGILEAANRGTVVFANIDCLDEEFQKRLYKIINELEDYDIDVRLVATTTKNLSKLVGAGRFNRGLYTLFANNAVSIPALRERQEDLQMLARHFMNEASASLESTTEIDSLAMDRITAHYWANNIHELKQVISSSINNNSSLLDESAYEVNEKKSMNFMNDDDSEGVRLMSLKDAEKLLIKKSLIHTSENRTQAAKILGVSIRTLRNKINEYRTEGSSYFVNLR